MTTQDATQLRSRRGARSVRGSQGSRGTQGSRGAWDSPVTSYYLISGITVLLVLIGLAMVLSASAVGLLAKDKSPYTTFLNQGTYAILGAVAMFVASRMRPGFYRKFAWPFMLTALAAQALIFTPLARSENGNTNWIFLGPVSFQPSEIVKLALAIWLGMMLARKFHLLDQWLHVFVPAIPVAGIAIGLVLAGHDLGTAMILMAIVAGAIWVAGVPLRMFAVLAAAAVGLGLAGIALQQNGNRSGRIDAWLGNDCGTLDACYQTQHGLWALGSGGLNGVGLGAGREKWLYLPEAHNDFIFAVVGEELGLAGTLIMLVLFALLGLAMTRLVSRHPDPFVKITTGGITCWVLGQAMMNIGVVIGLLPVIGIPLPLVSAGGSALIMTMAAMGVVISFARDEPGAREALTARSTVVRRSLAVVGSSLRRGRKDSKDRG